jgi:formylglycine-generating enzyme required for sulfatase activity
MKTKLALLLLMLLIAVAWYKLTHRDMTFKGIPAGTFTMGSPESEAGREDDESQHQVTISKPFYMQTTEVTQGQWKAVMDTEPWKGKQYVKEGPNYAASWVSWDKAVAYCRKLSEKEGKTYRLPTEAEWEYACRAGTETRWSFGDDGKELGDYAWYDKNAHDIGERYPHQVGLKKPNAFGLYDMHGNVYEWCHDYFEEDYYKQSPAKDPTGPVTGSSRVFRGGSLGLLWDHARSAYRGGSITDRWPARGFRVVREMDDSEALRMQAAAITAAIGKGDWETVLALDPDNEAGAQLKAAAVPAALAKGDWKAVLALDATNSEALRMQAAAITAAIGKGDWETVLALDPDNEAGAQLKAAAVLARAPITNSIGMTLNILPAGTFLMGSPVTEEDRNGDETQHKVTISKPFYMQTTEVTQGQWKAVMETEPWKGQGPVKEGPNYPASYVHWGDAVAYCKKLSEAEGKTYRLPTEAEWEYACRAGTETTWSFGNDDKVLGDYAWYRENAWDIDENYAHQVGLKKPNAFGLYDMHGNVFEWCHDSFEEDYYKQSPAKDPTGPQWVDGGYHVFRGGSWFSSTRNSRSALRNRLDAYQFDYRRGFRLVRELD